ncbi:MAG: UMP kinase [Methylococcales bacterium]|nr:UMP kinase [Methylococcales bacterium]
MKKLICQRILLKLSGEALMSESGENIDSDIITRLALDIKALCDSGLQVGLVIGGGNILRGAQQSSKGYGRVASDHMGMLATVINALAMQDTLEFIGQSTALMSALKIEQVCEEYYYRNAIAALERHQVVIFAAGIGSPFFTTDTAASLRAIEINAQLLIKATNVKGIYSADPNKDPNAIFYPRLTYNEAIDQRLNVMDTTALILCNDHDLPMRILNIFEPNALIALMQGEEIGSYIERGQKK